MIKAILLVFRPAKVWDEVSEAQPRISTVLATFLFPLLLVTCAVEGYGLVKWGEPQLVVKTAQPLSVKDALLFEAAQVALSLLIVLLGAGMVKSLGGTFHRRHTFRQAFTLVAYGLSPFFVMRMLDAAPISPWIAWAIGFFLSASALYQGVPVVMQPDPPQAFGLYLISVLLLGVTTGLARIVTAWYLQGKFGSLSAWMPSSFVS